ncbi:MAG TPA: hypothetical protein VFQ05_00740 [Candidatus Eisenbacteria bacterium]|nr:hypothetical protein [Candidatus Eisenbacteria bacterium]
MARRFAWVLVLLPAITLQVSTGGASAAATPSRFFPGDSVALVLRDSSRVSGVFLDLGRVAQDEYRVRYDRWRSESSAGRAMPEIGARIELVTGRITGSGKVSFCGLAHDGVAIRKGDGPIRTVAYDRFSKMRVEGGKSIESRRVQATGRDAETPLITALELRTASGTIAVPFDDVLAVQSAPAEATPRSDSRFIPASEKPRTTAAIQLGGLWAAAPSDLGLVGHGIYARISPKFVTPSLGLDFTTGLVLDDESDGTGLMLELALSGTIPMGPAIGIAPHGGFGVLLAGGFGVGTRTLGSGVFVRMSRGFGLRADYTYHWLFCENCNYQGFSEAQIGPYWGF